MARWQGTSQTSVRQWRRFLAQVRAGRKRLPLLRERVTVEPRRRVEAIARRGAAD